MAYEEDGRHGIEANALIDLKSGVQEELSIRVADLAHEPTDAELAGMIEDILSSLTLGLRITEEERDDLLSSLIDDFLHFGPLQPFLEDASVSDIMVNGPNKIFIEVNGIKSLVPGARFDDEAHLRRIIDLIGQGVNRRCDERTPIMDARLPDGSRVNATISPLSLDGSALTIRKFSKERMTAQDLIDAGSASPAMMAFLKAAVAGRCSIIVSGGTGTGKTTLLNVLSHDIPDDERVITIEDSAELQMTQDNLVRMESRPANVEGAGAITVHDLLVNALRQTPDRIIVGECRKEEALEMINAMTSGHPGSLTTVHADDTPTTFTRLENMIKRCCSGYDPATIKRMIAEAVNLVVVVRKYPDKSRKISSITALTGGIEGEVISREELFRFAPIGFGSGGRQLGRFEGCGIACDAICERIRAWGYEVDDDWFFDRFDPDEERAS